MFRHITRQAVRSMVTKPSEFPRGSRHVGTNLPFNIFKVDALTVKFILFFSSAFYIPFLALHFQLKNYNLDYSFSKKQKVAEVYKLIPEGQDKKVPEVYM